MSSSCLLAGLTGSRERACSLLKVETQPINVGMCRFYARQGCVLRTIRSRAYADAPDEVQPLWHRDLGPGPGTGG